MNTFSFNQQFNQSSMGERDVLAGFRRTSEKKLDIQRGMSPQEIAEVVSDRLMTVVRGQFEAARREFEQKESSK